MMMMTGEKAGGGRRGAWEREKDVNKMVEKEAKKKKRRGNVTADSVWDAAEGGGKRKDERC